MQILQSLQLDQVWNMFSPRPPNLDWYYNIEGTLGNGAKVEIWGNRGIFDWNIKPHSWEKPDIYESFQVTHIQLNFTNSKFI
jgi:hypothetical protein